MSSKNCNASSNSKGGGVPNSTNSSEVKYPTKYEIQKAWGGAQNFMHSYGLKFWNDDDVQEANAILEQMQEEEYQKRLEENEKTKQEN